jgi:hypothetical protein
MTKLMVVAIAATLTAVAAAPAYAAVAAPGQQSQAAAHRPPLHVISLHAEYQRAAPHASAGQIGGVVPPRGERLNAVSAKADQAGCKEPNCDLSYGGGDVQQSPHVYLLLWGPNWTTSSTAYSYMSYLYDGLGVSPQDTWSTITSQYGDSSGAPSFGKTVFEGAWQDTSTPPDPVTPDDLAAEADALATKLGITDLADAQIVVASQSGTCFSDGFAGSCGTISSSSSAYCGWHSITSSGLPFTNLPYQLDAGYECGENFINAGTAGEYDGFTIIGGHEYAETITDPDPFTAWSDPSDTISDGGSPGEVADKCVWGGSNWGKLGSDPYGDVTLSTGRFAMQSLWSNAAGRCLLTTDPVLNVSTSGTQTNDLGSRVSVQVQASTNTGTPLTYSATGLPDGLSINSSSGKISGSPGVTAGTYTTHVTVSGTAGSKTVSFGWLVGSKPGAVKGYASKCADDYRNRNRNGNKIDIWSCDGLVRQRITFTASRELHVAGRCITASSGKAVLDRCAGSSAQIWTRRSNGEYVVKSGDCLTDPGRSRRNGTQLRLETCTRAADQRWSLP